MPFTPSHAVVALPFIRTPLIPAAIAVGAMAPDLPLFVRGLPLHYGRTHDFAWVPATVALALVLLLIWRAVLRPAVRELMPTWLASRLPAEWDRGAGAAMRETLSITSTGGSGSDRRWRVSWRGMLILAVSLLLGVVSHIVWDLFTHEGRWGVEILPVLDEAWGPLLGFKWLQYGSGAVGVAIIGVWAVIWLSRREAAGPVGRVLPVAARWVWWLSLPVVLALAWSTGLAVWGPLDDDFTVAHLAYRVLPPACALWGAVTVVLCVVVQVARPARTRALNRP
ncbi:DUF4184 family protein [Microbacterium sp. SSM24]|uniref:DUF4184 family protein n=1 Tax=Microbacterium sp. SSM24 TaxID=2991714 RepID=UPI0022261C82|nr:DUF4184 family protein [Microbacterium sp. SSM24]MCW3494080.1 DUF4184 family protein [Microbacterium sp. SSM24]